MSAAVWVVVGGLAMFGMALAISAEMDGFPGGRTALAASVTASAEAMRVLRWPAERLDPLGGYLTFHNVILFTFMFAVYGAVQGSRAVRGGEEHHTLEEVLAAGVSRAAVVRDRAIGFAVTALAVSLGLGLATAAGLAVAGEPDLAGSLVTMGTLGLVGMVGFGLGLAVSQVTASARTAAGASGAGLTALYLATNMGDQLGAADAVRFVSPFHYANASRALVPGHGFDLPATAALVAMALILLALGAWAFVRRDYAAPLWSRAAPPPKALSATVPTVMLGSVWTAALRRGRVGLAVWAVGAAVLTALMASLQPAVMDMWAAFDFIGSLSGGGPGVSVETSYWSYASEVVLPVIAAYVIAQASGWVADLAQGRVEMLLAGPVSWTRLVLERLLALVLGVGVLTVVALTTLAVGAAAVGGTVDVVALGRAAVGCVLMGAALGGVAALVVAWVRRGAAVTVLAVVVAGSYLVSVFAAMFGWPDWLNRLSVFWAVGHPYLAWPSVSRVATLLVLAVPVALVASAIAERTPKTA